MDDIKLNLDFDKVLSIWWSMVWRTLLTSTVGGALLGGGVGFILGLTGLGDSAGAVGAILGWLISIPCSIWGLNSALHKKHKGYALRLVKVE